MASETYRGMRGKLAFRDVPRKTLRMEMEKKRVVMDMS